MHVGFIKSMAGWGSRVQEAVGISVLLHDFCESPRSLDLLLPKARVRQVVHVCSLLLVQGLKHSAVASVQERFQGGEEEVLKIQVSQAIT